MPNEQVWKQKEGSGWHGTALWLKQLTCRGRQLFELWKVVQKLSTWHSEGNRVVFCWKISKDSSSVVIWTAFHKLLSAVHFWHRNTECSKWWCASVQAAWLVWCQIHSPGQERWLLRGQCRDSWGLCGVRCWTGIYCSDHSARSNCGLVLSQGQSYANVIPHRSNKTQLEPQTPLISSKKENCASLYRKIPGGAVMLFFILVAIQASLHMYTPLLSSSLSIWPWAFLKTCLDTALIQFIQATL